MITSKLYKQGGSVVMAVPARFLKSLEWRIGDMLEILLVGGDQILVRKLTQQKEVKQDNQLWSKEERRT